MHRGGQVWLSIFIVLVAHIFFPLSVILQLWGIHSHDFIAWLLVFYNATGYVAFIYLAGAWSWFGRPARYLFPALLVLAAVGSYPTHHDPILLSSLANTERVVSICVGTIFFGFALFCLLSRRMNEHALQLTLPFRDGTFVVGQGGSRRLMNHHVVSPSQRYGLDILRLNSVGVRAKGLYPTDLQRYAIFGTEVVSPCEGVVAAAVDGFPDLTPPDRDTEHRAGNYVALECDGGTVYLAHLKQGSICVKPGERVHVGQMLGHVGNSGNTTEPHLHIHAEEGLYPGQFSGRPALAILFDQRFLVRNDVVRIPG